MQKMIKFIQHHKIKIVVLLLAIFLWAYVKTDNEFNWAIKAPVQITDLDPTLAIENELPENIHVRFKGKGRALISLSLNNDVDVLVNLADKTKGEHAIQMNEANVVVGRNDSEVEVIEPLNPSELNITLSPLLHKRIPVIPDVKVQTQNGCELIGAIQVTPESVMVSGPENLINDIVELRTVAKVYTNVRRDIHANIALQEYENSKVRIERSEVNIYADIQRLMERYFENIPVVVRDVPQGWKVIISPPTLSLTLEGGVDILMELQPEQIGAYIDWNKLKQNQIDYYAYIDLPDNIRIREVTPSLFKVRPERR